MTTLIDRPHTALLVVDVQQGVVTGAHERACVVATIAALVDRARETGTPVVWGRTPTRSRLGVATAWQYVPELVRQESEPLVHTSYGDSFEGTDLEDVLAAAGVGHLVVAGAEFDACIRSTIHGGCTRGYDVTLVGDVHTAGDKTAWGAPPVDKVIAHTNLH